LLDSSIIRVGNVSKSVLNLMTLMVSVIYHKNELYALFDKEDYDLGWDVSHMGLLQSEGQF
jgi:hypothetical protein